MFKFKQVSASLACLIPLNKFSGLIYSDSQSKHEARLLSKLWSVEGGGGVCVCKSAESGFISHKTQSAVT